MSDHSKDTARDTSTESPMDAEELTPTDVAKLVEQLHDGQVTAAALPVEVRRRCVEQLSEQALTSGEIAELMRTSERTVRRDRAIARRADGVPPSRELGDELLGEFERIATGSVARLTRLVREAECPPYARLWAEEAMVRIYFRYIEMARRMKYTEEGTRRISQAIEDDPAEGHRLRRRLERVQEVFRGM